MKNKKIWSLQISVKRITKQIFSFSFTQTEVQTRKSLRIVKTTFCTFSKVKFDQTKYIIKLTVYKQQLWKL